MRKIITEEMRYRQKVCEYALKHGVTKAARRYHTYRQFVYRQLERYDGIKHVPQECIRFPSYGLRYYQITAIDECSRKRVLKIVEEKSTYETTKFLDDLEESMGFPIHTIQVDNGCEFVNDEDRTNRESGTKPSRGWENSL